MRSLPQADAGGGAPGEPGFGHGARVVTAAIIMISVFAGFIPAPDAIIESIEFALGVAVLFDALIIRKTVVPAAMVLLGRSAWWLPCWLDRLLPDVDVDVEGEKLRHPARRRGRIRPVRPRTRAGTRLSIPSPECRRSGTAALRLFLMKDVVVSVHTTAALVYDTSISYEKRLWIQRGC